MKASSNQSATGSLQQPAAAVYARQCRTREGDMSSCDAQVEMCLDAARTRNWDVTGIFKDEGVSSETLERP
ncbi:recombinase family protein, partial [Novipirellula maiorica]|uniref:recombinase family protein n=1 Tax=Novipirellula maiorica TaxID=1265734 RepID=UPI0005948292